MSQGAVVAKKRRKRRGRGEGQVEVLPSGKFRAVVSAGVNPATGERRRLRATFDTKQAALAWLRDRLGEHARGVLADAGKLTLAEWAEKWLALKRGRVEPNSWRPLEQHVRRHILPRLGPQLLSRLSALDVEGLYAGMEADGHPAGKQRRVGGTLRSCLTDAVRLGLLHKNPATAVPLPRATPRRMTPLDAGQARQLLLAVAGDRLEAVYHLSLDAGMRQGEVLALHWPEVDLEGGAVTVLQSLEEARGGFRLKPPKTRAGRRRIPLAPSTVAALTRHKAAMKAERHNTRTGPVFVAPGGGWVTKSRFLCSSFRPALARAGLPRVRPHDLRHTMATLLLRAGVGVKVVSERLGHSDIALTLRTYTHVLPDMQDGAAAAMEKILWVD